MMSSHANSTSMSGKDVEPPPPLHLPRSAIQTEKWDECINKAVNETPLAYSWVLDHLNPGWEGIVFGDYEGVMPLPVSHRLGMKMIQMPPEVLTLGIFSDKQSIIDQFPEILQHPIFKPFRFIAYNGSPDSGQTSSFRGVKYKQSQELYLGRKYDNLFNAYSESHQRNIRSFQKKNGPIESEDSPKTFIHLIAEMGKKRPELFMPPYFRKRFGEMMQDAINKAQGILLSCYYNNEPVAAAFSLTGKKRTVLLHVANEKGRKLNASFGLINQFIKDQAGSNQILDFAGSSIPNVAEFNRRFGAVSVAYPSITINRLPFLMKAAKEMKLLFRFRHFFGR